MKLPFYDNREPDGQAAVVEVERVYCFEFFRFIDADWVEFGRICRELPHFIGFSPIARWFGGDEEAVPHLWGSVEPSGFQVVGVLARADWEAWDQQFRTVACHLPSFQIE